MLLDPSRIVMVKQEIPGMMGVRKSRMMFACNQTNLEHLSGQSGGTTAFEKLNMSGQPNHILHSFWEF